MARTEYRQRVYIIYENALKSPVCPDVDEDSRCRSGCLELSMRGSGFVSHLAAATASMFWSGLVLNVMMRIDDRRYNSRD